MVRFLHSPGAASPCETRYFQIINPNDEEMRVAACQSCFHWLIFLWAVCKLVQNLRDYKKEQQNSVSPSHVSFFFFFLIQYHYFLWGMMVAEQCILAPAFI